MSEKDLERAYRIYNAAIDRMKEKLSGNNLMLKNLELVEGSILRLVQAIENKFENETEAKAQHRFEEISDSYHDRLILAQGALHGTEDRVKSRLLHRDAEVFLLSLEEEPCSER